MLFNRLRIDRKILVVLLSLFLFVLVIFLALIPVAQWLWLGWLYGSVSSLLTYLVNVWLVKLTLSNASSRTKFFGFMVGFGKTFINLVSQILFCLVLVVVNNLYFGKSAFAGGVWVHIHGPIEIFTYFGGVGLGIISTIIAAIADLRKKEV